mgnify:CR=1 FL=1
MKMSFKRKDIEIMAPVGSYESLRAAIDAGADSVYFGVGQLNMRSRSAANFTLDDLARIVSIARRHNVKTYLAVNTLLYDADLPAMRQTPSGLPHCSSRQGWPGRMPVPDGR